MDLKYENKKDDLSLSVYEEVKAVYERETFRNNNYLNADDKFEIDTQNSKISKNQLDTIIET